MKDFIHDEFLLDTPAGRALYHDWAEPEPILDYHNHLSPADIAADRQFANLTEIWLEGDHYKWRALRANGVAEKFCTGDADPFEKFQAWAATVPRTLRNPLYHWTHLELKRYFGITELLDANSAARIWAQANEMLATPEFSARGILRKFRVQALCTTDDPTDDLGPHRALATDPKMGQRVFPAFRPDKAFGVQNPASWNAWVDRLAGAADCEIGRLDELLTALDARMTYFHAAGCRLSDHGLMRCPEVAAGEGDALVIFAAARAGKAVSAEDGERFTGFLLNFLGRSYAKRGWTMQLHLGPQRSNSTRMLQKIGPDTGFDSIGDAPQALGLQRFLDGLDRDDQLPRTILYNVNPADNYVFATMAGNFQDGVIPGKVQWGSAWWFLDQKQGMEWQLNTLSNVGLLSRFVGMVTDSRSLMSFPRHEYFRRTLCGLLGRDIGRGELPDDLELVGAMVRDICHTNARDYLRLPGYDAASA